MRWPVGLWCASKGWLSRRAGRGERQQAAGGGGKPCCSCQSTARRTDVCRETRRYCLGLPQTAGTHSYERAAACRRAEVGGSRGQQRTGF